MSGIKRKHRRGVQRVLVHVVLFALIGLIGLGLGAAGRSLLAQKTESERLPARVKAIHENTEKLLKTALQAATDDTKVQKEIQKGFSAKKTAVKTAIEDGLNAGSDERDVIRGALETYIASVDAKLAGMDAQAAVKAEADARLDELVETVAGLTDGAAEAITMASVKKEMNVSSTKNYAIMYYWQALLIIGAILMAAAVLLLLLWLKRDEEGRAALGALLEPLDYLLPFFVGVCVFTFYPMIRVAIMSFQEKYTLGKNANASFIKWGLGNYKFVLFGLEGTTNIFMRSLKNTALYVVLTVPITAAISILMAYLLNQKIKLNGVFQTAYFIPMVTTATAVGLVWRWMFNENFGLINAIITTFGGEKINWLQSGNHAISMAVLVIYGVWSGLPFTIILLLSGLQNIDENLYTVARVDGSGAARIFFRITVPLLSPTIGLVLIINSISAFKVYTDVIVLWNGSPESYGMETVAWYIYNNINTADGTHSLGYAAAAAMVLFLIIFVFTMIQKVIQRKWVYQ